MRRQTPKPVTSANLGWILCQRIQTGFLRKICAEVSGVRRQVKSLNGESRASTRRQPSARLPALAYRTNAKACRYTNSDTSYYKPLEMYVTLCMLNAQLPHWTIIASNFDCCWRHRFGKDYTNGPVPSRVRLCREREDRLHPTSSSCRHVCC